MARSKRFASIILLCLFFTVSLADAINDEDDSANQASNDVVPLTKLTLRPINRRFPLRPHHQRHVEVIPYSDDAAVSPGENGDFENPLFHHHHFHHHHFYDHHDHHEDSDSDDDDEDDDHRLKKMVFKRYNHEGFSDGREDVLKKIRKHRHHHGLDHEHHHYEGGFMKRMRKFFDRYF